MQTFKGLEEFEEAVGSHLGYSRWHTVTQERINLFAQATGDHQWIHVDPGQAVQGPFGTTIAHGYLTLALIPMLTWEIYAIQGVRIAVNYGSNKVRFPSPVPVDSIIRAGAELVGVSSGDSGVLSTIRVTVEREGGDKPICVAETLSLLAP